MFFQQSTGVNALVFHTVNIFHIAGSELDGRYCTIIVGFGQIVFTIASGFFVRNN
jgi:facilitated trehalose transporter